MPGAGAGSDRPRWLRLLVHTRDAKYDLTKTVCEWGNLFCEYQSVDPIAACHLDERRGGVVGIGNRSDEFTLLTLFHDVITFADS